MTTVIYGISPSTDMFIKSAYNDHNNAFFCTNGGQEYQGIIAGSLIDLAKINPKTIERVVICSEFVSEILVSLDKCGIGIEKCFFFNHLIGKLLPCVSLATEEQYFQDTLYAFYDLDTFIPSYDVITFVILSEVERIKQNKKRIQFILVPAGGEGRPGINVYYTKSDTQWRIEKILIPSFSLLESFAGVEYILNREQISYYQTKHVSTFPQQYFKNHKAPSANFTLLKQCTDNGVPLSYLRAPAQASQIVKHFFSSINAQNKKVISITLRDYWANSKGRNSNIIAWLEFAQSLNPDEFIPIIIKDTYSLHNPLPEGFDNLMTFDLASIDLHLRVALYELAFINMGVESGPVYPINFLKGARSIIFKKIDNSVPGIAERSISVHHFTPGENHYFADNQYQITAWMEDSYANICSQFDQLNKKIASTENHTDES